MPPASLTPTMDTPMPPTPPTTSPRPAPPARRTPPAPATGLPITLPRETWATVRTVLLREQSRLVAERRTAWHEGRSNVVAAALQEEQALAMLATAIETA